MNNIKRIVVGFVIAVAFVFSLTISPLMTLESYAANGVQREDMAWEVLDIVNRERAANGLSPLTMDKGLMQTAQLRATEISDVFSHTRPDGTDCFTAFPDGQNAKGENIAMGQMSASHVMECWMNSPGHRANILNSRYNSIGIACYYVPGSGYQYHWVQCFGDRVNEGLLKGGVPSSPVTTTDGSIPMYRAYNPNSGEHFYTSNYYEVVNVGAAGWNYEQIAWYAPSTGTPVYRMYNPNVGDHHYTMNWAEVEMLKGAGWNYEGEAWKSGGSVKMLRAYNPNAVTGTHHYTSNPAELRSIVAVGWRDEGYGWYALR